MKNKFIFLFVAFLFGGMLLFSSDSAIARKDASLTFMCVAPYDFVCDFQCPNCGTLFGSSDGELGVPTDIRGTCPACDNCFGCTDPSCATCNPPH